MPRRYIASGRLAHRWRPYKVSVFDLEPITERTFTDREYRCVGNCGALVDRSGQVCIGCAANEPEPEDAA